MKSKNFIIGLHIFIVLLIMGNVAKSQILYNNIGHIPTSYQEDWTSAGLYQNMSVAKRVFNVMEEAGTLDEKEQSAVNKAKNASRWWEADQFNNNFKITKELNMLIGYNF